MNEINFSMTLTEEDLTKAAGRELSPEEVLDFQENLIGNLPYGLVARYAWEQYTNGVGTPLRFYFFFDRNFYWIILAKPGYPPAIVDSFYDDTAPEDILQICQKLTNLLSCYEIDENFYDLDVHALLVKAVDENRKYFGVTRENAEDALIEVGETTVLEYLLAHKFDQLQEIAHAFREHRNERDKRWCHFTNVVQKVKDI